MAEDQEQTRLLQQMLAALQKSSGNTNTKDVEKAKKALEKFTMASIRGKRAKEDEIHVMGVFVDGTKQAVLGTSKFVQATAAAAGAIRENREDFTSLNGSIALVGNGMQMASKTIGALGDAAGDALKGIPYIGPALGGVVSAAAKVTAALGQAAGEIVKTIGPMLTAELQRASTAYRKAGEIGALGADGLTGLANQAIKAGLSFNSFAGVINKTGPQLTFALGNSADAAQTLANTSKDMQPFRRGLLALGIGVEQQNELTANYIGLQQRLNRGQSRDSRALAAGSKNYIQQLTELSKLTGKSVSEQQKELDEQTRHVRQGAALREVERKLGGEAGQKASAAIQGVSAVLAKAAPTLSAGFSDALGGNFASEAGKNFYRATGEAGKTIMAQLKAGTISREAALAGIQEAAAKRYASLGGDKFAMAAGNTGTALEAILVDLQSLTFGAKFSDQIGKIEESTKKTMSTTDKTTNSMINAQESMIKAGAALDKLALQTSLPLAAASIEKFTEYTVIASKKMLAYAKAFSEGGIDAVTAQLKKDVTGDSSSPADIATVDAQDEKNKELRTSGANFLNSMSYWFESSTEKAERVAKETGMLKARGKQNIGADYQKQFGSKIDASVKKTKLKDLQKAEVQSYSRGGTTGSGIYGGYAGPTNNLSSANLGSAVTQNLGTTPTTTNAGTATAGQNQAAGSDAILTVIAGELQTNNALQKKILQASRN
jgi:hypothetical protein